MSTAYVVQWNKTQNTWHVDIGSVGRYSVQRDGGKWRAYLNNELIEAIRQSASAESIKTQVAERIIVAKSIADGNGIPTPYTAETRRAELVSAAKGGIGLFLNSTRGANMFGSKAKVVDTPKGFCVVFGDDNRVYFDTTEM